MCIPLSTISHRPISTVRYIEWAVASPLLMSLVGRSIPRLKGTTQMSGKMISDTLRPGLVVTVSYIFAAWLALPVVDPVWRWILIFFSLMGYTLSVVDQVTAWQTDADTNATCYGVSDLLLKIQILVYLAYGIVFLVALFDLVDPITEQALLAYVDATIKLTCSASLAAIRYADSLAEARRERAKADSIASDLRHILRDANAPIFALDAEGNITHWNEKLAKLTGTSLDDVAGKPLVNYLSEESRDEFQDVFDKRKRGKDMELDHCNMIDMISRSNNDSTTANGVRVVSMKSSVTALHDVEGRFVGIVGVGSDLSEITRIKAVEEKKNQFMAVVSHELKSPLHGIIGLAEALSQSEKVTERKSQLKMVKSCAVRLLDLVSNIMQMSRLARDKSEDDSVATGGDSSSGGKEKLRKDPVDIASIVNEVCMLVSNATDKGNRPLLSPLVKFENRLSQDNVGLPIVEGDAYKITQVFYNLLTNASKFCTHGSITVDAVVKGSSDDTGRLEVSITDTGCGINAENVKRVFEPFEQESNSSSRSFGGIGLGLAISKQVIELHGGNIFLESTPGKGSKFTVSLPVPKESTARAILPPPDTIPVTHITRASSMTSFTRLNRMDSAGGDLPFSCGSNAASDETITILSGE